MSVDAFTLPFTTEGLPLHANPNPNVQQAAVPPPAAKKKRNLPGTPDPDAEVIALSPKTLMATNRFVCEICSKGFQRDQNLQLHRRGHNLPWKLRQRSGNQPRKRVYICPEASCIHHDPSRALGDLTGIKKHFSRKHGEKRWKCERCSKRYAVQSDWKAHSKTCGSREYKCDCGTIFSRKDSFITHRAFCDALIRDAAAVDAYDPPTMPMVDHHGDAWRPSNPEFFDVEIGLPELLQMPPSITSWPTMCRASLGAMSSSFGVRKGAHECRKSDGVVDGLASLYSSNQNDRSAMPVVTHLSATALLQKAAQMGATTSNTSSSSFLVGLLSSSPSLHPSENQFQLLATERAASESYQELTPTTFGLTSGEMIVGGIENLSGPMAAIPPGSEWNPSGEKVDNGFTRDFLGLGGNGSGRAPARFPPTGSAMELVSSAYRGIGGH